MRFAKWICAAALMLALVPLSIAEDKMNIIRGNIYYSNPTGDLVVEGDKLEPDNAVGLQASYERKFSDFIGINFVLGVTNYDTELKTSGLTADFSEGLVAPVSANLLFHPIQDGAVDWYIGPGVSYVFYDDLELESPFDSLFGQDKLKVKNDFAFGAQTGLDIKFGDGTFALNIDVQYLKTAAELDEPGASGDELDFDPINVGAGISIRF